MTKSERNDMGKDLTTGAVIFAGGVILAIAADASLPILAAAGALAALGAGVYQVVTLPHHRSSGPSSPSRYKGEDDPSNQKTLVGRY
jgi:hypothetical protein